VGRCPPPLGRAARVEDPKAAVPRDLRLMRVAVDDGVTALEPAGQPVCAPARFTGVVRHPDSRLPHLDDAAAREDLLQLAVVHVPVDGLESTELAELGENLRLHEVARVQDQVRTLEIRKALGGDPARSARKVRVRDDRD
jgi:hypothetical protein